MQKGLFKLNIVIIIIILFNGATIAQIVSNDFPVFDAKNSNNNDDVIIEVQNAEDVTDVTRINYRIDRFKSEDIMISNKNYIRILLDDEPNMLEKGKPDLPNICRSIIIPDDAEMNLRIVNSVYQDYNEILIAPSKGVISRSGDPADIPYEFDEMYEIDEWYPKTIIELNHPYILRDFRGQVIRLYPFQYNPVTRTLRFYTEITIDVFPVGAGRFNVLNRNRALNVLDSDFKIIYKNHFLNFNSYNYTPVEEQGNLLVITYDGFWNATQPLIRWKNMKGVPTETVNISDIGSNSTLIRNYIEDYYHDKGLTFVLLVGDAEQIPTPQVRVLGEYGASDPTYSYIVGDDHYPDLFVGRFSARNVDQVNTQVERSIEYEKYPQMGAEWYHKGMGIASNEGGTGHAGDDGEADWEHIRNISVDLMNYTYTQVDELYDGSHDGEDAPGNPNVSMVSNSINDGRGIINYCGHGGPKAWATSYFNKSHVKSLTNDNMLPFICSVACWNGNFDDYNSCFAEAWLRATHNGEPTGAIAFFGSSVQQHWNPPMDAQDEMIDILVESYANNKKYTFGGLAFNGCMHMNDEYQFEGYQMTDTWHIFGDPSLVVRTDTPDNITALHDTAIVNSSTSFEVKISNTDKALCAISHNYNLLGYGYTDVFGNAMIEFNELIANITDVDLVVTAYNKNPYITTIPIVNEPIFVRGDADENRLVDVGDVIYLINYLYKSGLEPVPVLDAGDANDDEVVDIGDVIYIINFLFKNGLPPPHPYPNCGIDPT